MASYQLTETSAFEVMYHFLAAYASRIKSDDLNALVLDLSHPFGEDPPVTVTPGWWEDWMDSVRAVVQATERR